MTNTLRLLPAGGPRRSLTPVTIRPMSHLAVRVPGVIAVGVALAACPGAQGALTVPAAGAVQQFDPGIDGEPHVLVHLTAQPSGTSGLLFWLAAFPSLRWSPSLLRALRWIRRLELVLR